MFESKFFGASAESRAGYLRWVRALSEDLISALPAGPYAGDGPGQLSALLATDICPDEGISFEALRERLRAVISKSIALWHPHTAAHLHTPVLLPAVAAEMAISALNQSMDSFDQAPAATVIEQQVLGWLCRLAGLPPSADGTFTAGGTQSNYLAMLLARDRFLESRWGWSARLDGMPPEASRLRILCSEAAHFSVEKSAMQLGLGTRAVVKVACDDECRLCPADLRRQVRRLRHEGLEPMAVVATAGTTDFGSFDPIDRIAEIAADEGLWLHVDAAYGGALLMSRRLRHQLAGLGRADSVTIDFHKAFFQPISCGAFLLAERGDFDLIRVHADYLNSEDRELDGIPDLVTRSLLTTRRFDALKLWVSLQALGGRDFAAMIEWLHGLARLTAIRIAETERLELLNRPQFGCVVFRYLPEDPSEDADSVNGRIARALFERGLAVIGRTRARGRTWLKLTLNNPRTHPAELNALLETVVGCGQELSAKEAAWLHSC
ncbi:MAG TPA: aspartate aminotransferase family protein [Blastocatellia bacterium]|nr:aspartate aminotransferase family protein [Blastocatellia bacterium]